jgi:aminoglycoside phosphotransferase (APT) family kinase protein
MEQPFEISTSLVSRLVASQFPQWKHLPVIPIHPSGWDNRTYRLGDEMIARLPSAPRYEEKINKEFIWLPKLAPLLPLQIPFPLEKGTSCKDYPFNWLINRWIEGQTACTGQINDLTEFAFTLASFLTTFQHIDTNNAPLAGLHSSYRGGSIAFYNKEVNQALNLLQGKIDSERAKNIWEKGLTTSWKKKPLWVHGDINLGNLLVRDGKLVAIIDFGQLAIGDPACDLTIAWTFFQGKSRAIFKETLALDEVTWHRSAAWALWKALVFAAGLTTINNAEAAKAWSIIDELCQANI